MSIKISIFLVSSLAIYGAVGGAKAVLQNIKINSDNYEIENVNVNLVNNQYIFSGEAMDVDTGSVVKFDYASSDLINNRALTKAILDKLAIDKVKKK